MAWRVALRPLPGWQLAVGPGDGAAADAGGLRLPQGRAPGAAVGGVAVRLLRWYLEELMRCSGVPGWTDETP